MPSIKVGSNRFCVPAALAALTSLSVDEAEEMLKEELGDIPITGVFYPILLKCLGKLGYQYQEVTKSIRNHSTEGLFLICYPGHVGVIEGKTYYDNQFPRGIDLKSGKHPRMRIEVVFKVWKEGTNA